MATTGTILAKNMKFYVGSVAVTCQVDTSLSLSTNMIQTTCKDSSGAAANLPGGTSWEASVSGNMAFDATYGYSQLFAAWLNGTAISMVYQTAVVGDKKISGTCYINSLTSNSSGNDEAVTFECGLTGTGVLVEATVA